MAKTELPFDIEEEKSSFPTNSHKARPNTKLQPPPIKKVEKVIQGKVVQQKKGLGKKFVEMFLGEETVSVRQYIIQDVLIQAAKTMICDMVGWGGAAELILFGDKRGKNTQRDGGRSRTTYYKMSDRDRDSRDRDTGSRREISHVARSRFDFEDLVLDNRGEAEDVLTCLIELTDKYQQATVADLYDLVGITPQFTDEKYGWYDLHEATISRARRNGGYLINLPRPQPLD